MIGAPRIQGRVGQVEDPPELKGKWTFTIWVSCIGDGEEPQEIFSGLIFETEEQALQELKNATQIACEAVQEKLGVPKSEQGYFLDLQSNEFRNFREEN